MWPVGLAVHGSTVVIAGTVLARVIRASRCPDLLMHLVHEPVARAGRPGRVHGAQRC